MKTWNEARDEAAKDNSIYEWINSFGAKLQLCNPDRRDSFQAGADFGRAWKREEMEKVAEELSWFASEYNEWNDPDRMQEIINKALAILQGVIG